jgi:recombination protein RecR
VLPESAERLVTELERLPGVGRRTAQRLAFFLLRASTPEALGLADAIRDAKQRIGLCGECFGLAESRLCDLCADPRRDRSMICVVEAPADVVPIERTAGFHGVYHVLGGALSPLDGVDPDHIRINELVDRVKQGGVSEVIIATNPTMSGEATAAYIAGVLRGLTRVTRLASGLPVGGDLEFADEVTIGRALQGRRDL